MADSLGLERGLRFLKGLGMARETLRLQSTQAALSGRRLLRDG